MYKNRTTCSLTIIAVFIAVLFCVSIRGKSTRLYSPSTIRQSVDSPEKAYHLWNDNNVKGRILILFDNYPHAIGLLSYKSSPTLTATNFIEYSVFDNIIRKIYFIVPDKDWNDFTQQRHLRPLKEYSDIPRGLALYTKSGIPIIATTPTSLPHISEAVLVYVNTKVFDDEQTSELLSQKKISPDIYIACRGSNS